MYLWRHYLTHLKFLKNEINTCFCASDWRLFSVKELSVFQSKTEEKSPVHLLQCVREVVMHFGYGM
jgi:hypothetical protein